MFGHWTAFARPLGLFLCMGFSAAGTRMAAENLLPLKTVEVKPSGEAEARRLGDGTVDVKLRPGEGWPQLRLFNLPTPPPKADALRMTFRLIEPADAPARVGLALRGEPPEAIKGDYFHTRLTPGKPAELWFSGLTPALKGVIIAAKNPTEPVHFVVEGLYYETTKKEPVAGPRGLMLRPRQEPLPPVLFRGRPFFPIGCYDTWRIGEGGDLASVDPAFVAAGGNFADFGQLHPPESPSYAKYGQPAIFAALEKLRDNPDARDIALLVNLSSPLLMDAGQTGGNLELGGDFRPLSPEKLAEHKAILADAVKRLAGFPNVVGYAIDEPENVMWPHYKRLRETEWAKDKEADLVKVMIDWLDWPSAVIREFHPEAKRFPIIAWWSTYKPAGAMYDVLIANQYPIGQEGVEFSAPLYEVSYDAAMAVAAARANGGGRTVVYMPPMYDILPGFTTRTLAEQMYVNFAPITRGVMGVHGWRLQRCSEAHRTEVVYPAMRAMADLSEFFLGEWLDEYVASDRDETTADYLKSFADRVRLVPDSEDGVLQSAIVPVPDASYCLRRHPDGRYLLLAVNNRREPINVTFRLGLASAPAEVRERFSGRTAAVAAGVFTDAFTPFAVHAYEFK